MTKNTEAKTPFEEALERAYEVTGADNPTELVGILGLSRQSFYKAKSSLMMPRTWAKKLQNILGINPDWIISGTLPKHMTEYHHNLGDTLYAMRNELMDMLSDFGPRYGVTSEEVKLTSQLLDIVDRLRSRLDERALVESPDMPKADRLKQYYRGREADGIRIRRDDSSSQQAPTSTTSSKTEPGKELEEIRATLQAVGASEDEIKQALIDYVSGGRIARDRSTGTDDGSI